MPQIASAVQIEHDAAKAAFDAVMDKFRVAAMNADLRREATEAARRLDAAQIAAGVGENIGCTYCRTGMDKFSEEGIRYALGFGLLNYGDAIKFERINPNVSWPADGSIPQCYKNLGTATELYVGRDPDVHQDRIVPFERSADGARGFFQRSDNGVPVPSIGFKHAKKWRPSETSRPRVWVDDKGCPVIVPIIAEVILPPSRLLDTDDKQFRHCNKQLRKYIKDNPTEAEKFLPVEVIRKFRDGEMNWGGAPNKYTWHHHQDTGRMQLVSTELHELVNHTGGQAISGGDRRRETRNKLTGERERLLYEEDRRKSGKPKTAVARKPIQGIP
jgi:hypothetical protein